MFSMQTVQKGLNVFLCDSTNTITCIPLGISLHAFFFCFFPSFGVFAFQMNTIIMKKDADEWKKNL